MVFIHDWTENMALQDYLWLVRLVIEILKLIAHMTEDDRAAIARLRVESETQEA